jgi:hypothetical protein
LDRDESRKNIQLGVILFVTALLMFAISFIWALLYNNLV